MPRNSEPEHSREPPADLDGQREPEPWPLTPEEARAAEEETDALLRRLWRNAVAALLMLAAATGLVTRDAMDVVGVALAGTLMLLSHRLLISLVGGALRNVPEMPGKGRLLLVAGRFVLMALVLYGIFRLPGVGPIPVALGLSVLVLAVLVEALVQLVSGPRRHA